MERLTWTKKPDSDELPATAENDITCQDLAEESIQLGREFLAGLAFSGLYRLGAMKEFEEFSSWSTEEFEQGYRSALSQNFIYTNGSIVDVSPNGWMHLREAGLVDELEQIEVLPFTN